MADLTRKLAESPSGVSVGIIGLGYVGLPLLMCFHEAGVSTVGFDIDPKKPDALAIGENYLPHLGVDLCKPLVGSGRFKGTTDETDLQGCDALIVCVPTPLGKHSEPDLSFVRKTGEMIGRICRPGQLIILESTSYPGTTREVFLPAIRSQPAGAAAADTLLVAFSPERENPGDKEHTTRNIPKLIGGLTPEATRQSAALYSIAIERVITVASAEVAEAAKVFENVFRSVNIALVNELKLILEPMGINVWDVIAAAGTKPFGFMSFAPGPGLGGHCIPIDPYYLAWKAREFKVAARFIELAGEINTAMPARVVQRVVHALNQRGRSVKGSRILVLGLAYKPDIADDRESPSFELIDRLEELGASVDYTDPYIAHAKPGRKHNLGKSSVALTAGTVRGYDALLISTNHTAFDYAMIAAEASLVVDTRNAMAPFSARMGDRLVLA
ncbi:MAG: nucleotide sugar dehydrogenase [Phycisphaerales bacterium]|nr:nucleotide sugar dehydrogenase [Phycisphaerales bacterium]